MAIENVTIDKDGCIGCGVCVNICGDVFEMDGEKAKVKKNANYSEHEAAIKEAVNSCPVDVISYD